MFLCPGGLVAIAPDLYYALSVALPMQSKKRNKTSGGREFN